MKIDWAGSDRRTDSIAQEMFGTNFLYDRDQIGPNGTFDDSMRALNIEDVRFPGGSITEWYFDINDPEATRVWAPDRNAWRDVMPISEFMGWAAREGVGVNLVVPTGSLMDDGPRGDRQVRDGAAGDIYRYITDVLEGDYGAARIDTIEIGNEYWLGAELNQVEYSRIANVMAETAQSAIDDHRDRAGLGNGWQEPEISVQVGQFGRYSTDPGWVQNQQIMAWMTPEAVAAIDAVVVHYYTKGNFNQLDDFSYYFDRLDDWSDRPEFRDIEYHVTEWNVLNDATEELGLKHASALWQMFADMVERGVDVAHVWPIQQNNKTDLSGNEGQSDLTIPGEAFRLLSEATVGTTLTHRTEWNTGAAWVYEGAGASHVFLASRSDSAQTFTLDRADLGLEGSVWWKSTLGSTGAPGDHTARPVLEVRGDVSADWGVLTFDLQPYEVMRATFYDRSQPTGPGQGFPDTMTGGSHNDTIIASHFGNTLDGRGGDDMLRGGHGADDIRAGGGNDIAQGWLGDDTLEGGAGRDTLQGGEGDDAAFGGSGADTLEGWLGDDLLAGGAGDDRMQGGAGNDTLWGGAGLDYLDGGGGNDTFVFTRNGGPDSWDGAQSAGVIGIHPAAPPPHRAEEFLPLWFDSMPPILPDDPLA
jgi:hypothetical protein